MTRRPLFLGLCVLCLVIPIPGCGAEETGVDAPPDRVVAVVLPFLTMTPFHIAAEEGYFTEQNLDVEFVRLPRQQELMAVLASGDVDVVASMISVNTLNMVARGARVRLVATLGHLSTGECPFNAFMVRRELFESGALQDPEQVRGLLIDADIVLPFGYFLHRMLEPLGLTIDDVELTNLPPAASVQALINDSVDVTVESEPFISTLLASGEAVIWQETSEIVPDYLMSVMRYGPSLLDDRPEVGTRFAVAMLKAIRQFHEGKTTENVSLLSSFTGLSAEQATEACWPTGPDDARVDISTLIPFQEWLVSQGLVERVLSEDEMVDHRFMDGANAILSR